MHINTKNDRKGVFKMKKVSLIGMLVLGLAFMGVQQAFAVTTKSHNVTLDKPAIINIASTDPDFTLTFSDFVSGTESDNAVVITYRVKSNGMGAAGTLKGNLDALFTDVDLIANVGTYSDLTNPTDKVFTPVAGDITIDVDGETLANSSGAGKLHGDMPVTYKAVATADLDATNQTKQLTVTIADL
jgi:hypothetical protein